MSDFDNETVTPPAAPVRDDMEFESVTFRVRNKMLYYAELRCAATSSTDPDVSEETAVLRRFATAKQFLTDFCAGPKDAVKAWLQAQTNEQPS